MILDMNQVIRFDFFCTCDLLAEQQRTWLIVDDSNG